MCHLVLGLGLSLSPNGRCLVGLPADFSANTGILLAFGFMLGERF